MSETLAPGADVSKMSLKEKISVTVHRAIPRLPQDAKAVALAMVSPHALEAMAVTLTAWVGAQFIGVGVIADLFLLLAGYVMAGKAALDASKALLHFAIAVTKAKTDADLNRAASYFEQAVMLAGITVVSWILLGRGGNKPKPGAAPPPPPPAPVAAAAEEATLYARTLPRINLEIVKRLVINGWQQAGKWPVKVLRLRAGQAIGDAVPATGYITTENAVAGAGLRELERRLGLAAGSLGDGAIVIKLRRLPGEEEFGLRFYNNVHGGGLLPPNPKYPLGPGFPQWEITKDMSIPAAIVKIIR
jgi:hypothetical protein